MIRVRLIIGVSVTPYSKKLGKLKGFTLITPRTLLPDLKTYTGIKYEGVYARGNFV